MNHSIKKFLITKTKPSKKNCCTFFADSKYLQKIKLSLTLEILKSPNFYPMKKLFITIASFVVIVSGCNSQSNWSLITQATPVTDQSIVYEGEAMLNGWGVEVPYYTGEPELHFHVSPNSISNLPQDFSFQKYDHNFKLEDDEELLQFLSQSTQEYPVEIKAVKITIPQEGHPLMKIKGYSQVVQ